MSNQILASPEIRPSQFKQKARIGIDATSIAADGKGISRYEKNLVRALVQSVSDHEYFVFFNEKYRNSLGPDGGHAVPVPIWKSFFWEQMQFPHYAKRWNLDLLHYTSYRLPSRISVPVVLTIFEVPRLMPKENAKWYDSVSNRLTQFFFPRSLQSTSRIIVASLNVQEQLVRQFQVPGEKIRVIYPGCEQSFRPCPDKSKLSGIRKKMNLPESYLLSFATGDSREQTEFVVQAFRQAKKNLPSMKLVLAGGKHPQAEDLISLPYLSDEDLIAVYQGASLYIDSSLHEGFGFHPLEAMSCGIPVVAFNTTSIPEILGSAGICHSPKDSPEALAKTMVDILTHSNLWNELSEKGLKRAGEFNWEKTAAQTAALYQEVLSGVSFHAEN